MKLKLPHSVYNWTTLAGVTIALISLFMIVFLFIISTFIQQGSSYLGLIIYIVLPAFLIAGLILIPVGMWSKHRRMRAGEDRAIGWPVIDLNTERNRNAFIIFASGTTLFLLLSAIGSYQAFTFTESVEFCGTICHGVMKPEYTAYRNSPHAKVACVECHVGSGANWYVRSKLSGLYQVYAVTFNVYPRPIPTPISNLRPARETCEHCHWPSKFYGESLVLKKYYLADEANTPWQINMAVKIGPSHSAHGLSEGIHWHINPDVKIEYAASDPQRQSIVWVRYTNRKTGAVTVYQDEDDRRSAAQIDSLGVRTMDCIDCHNRPSHNYLPPQVFIDHAMEAGVIDRSLPSIKRIAMELIGKPYGTTDSAHEAISRGIEEFYRTTYPDIAASRRQSILASARSVTEEYSKNIFPEMQVRWSAYPSNIGHMEFDGCFRCHNDRHQSESGRKISKDCNLCHTIYAQGNPASLAMSPLNQPMEFQHPSEIGDVWKESLCTSCHTGLNP
ncbi:MAG: cytochrome c3 family protein [Acidobacteriota bacterium]